MPRGGRRRGVQGRQYAERTDLQLGQRQPIMKPPSTRYGEQAQLIRDQQALPVQTPPAPAPQAPSSPQFQPTEVVPISAPTQRPNEPVTAGLNAMPRARLDTAAGLLSQIAGSSPEAAELLDYLQSGGN